jgi:hypothetical protein
VHGKEFSEEEITDKMARAKTQSPYDATGNQAVDFLIGDAQMSIADPNIEFGTEDIQSLKSDIFAMSLGMRDGARLRATYGPSIDAMESSLSKRRSAAASGAYRALEAERLRASLSTASEASRREKEAQQKYGEIAGRISSILESEAPAQVQSRGVFNTFLSNTATGKRLMDMTTQQLALQKNPNLHQAQSKVLSDAISSGSTEAIGSTFDSMGIVDEDLRQGALQAAAKKQRDDAQAKQEDAYEDQLRALNSYADDALTKPTYQKVFSYSEQLIPAARRLGLTEIQAFKDLTTWMQKPPKSGGDIFADTLESPVANIRSLLFEMTKISSIPGARQSGRRNPSARSSASLDTLGIPSR